MKRWLLGWVLTVAATFTVAAAPPTPLLWKAEKNDTTVYLLGSFHLLTANDYPVDESVEAAYKQAGTIVFEVHPDEMNSQEMLAEVERLSRFDDGRTLRSVISEATAEKLKAFMGGSEAALTSSDIFKPWFMSLNLSVGMMTSFGLNPALGLDQHFMTRAKNDQKNVGGLETVIEQIGALANAPMEEQVMMLDDALAPAAELRKKIFEMHDLWRAGDELGLMALIVTEMKTKTPESYRLLNYERNQNWLPKVQEMLAGDDDVLVIVGAMHLLGEDGLVEQLRKKGLTVERVN